MNPIAVAFTLLATSAAADPVHEYSVNDTKAQCATEWQDDFAMQKYCQDQIEVGFQRYSFKLKTMRGLDASSDLSTFESCASEWYPKLQMADHCFDQHIKGVREFNVAIESLPNYISKQVVATCSARWHRDFRMLGYCAEKQATAWRATQYPPHQATLSE